LAFSAFKIAAGVGGFRKIKWDFLMRFMGWVLGRVSYNGGEALSSNCDEIMTKYRREIMR
jgi:hypothetical protein